MTRRLQEWACLLGIDFSFPIAQRLLGWQARGGKSLLCPKEVQRLVCRHGQVLREAAAAEVQELLARPHVEGLTAQWVPAAPPRRPAAWPQELQEVVATALRRRRDPTCRGDAGGLGPRDGGAPRRGGHAGGDAGPPRPPSRPRTKSWSVPMGCWCANRRRRVGGELRTACVATPQGYRFLCGTGWLFLQQLWLSILLAGGRRGWVTFVSDGARWLRDFAQEQLQPLLRRR